jgi:hypothetical protein
MSVSIQLSEFPVYPPPPRSSERVLSPHFAVIREMLATLETLTTAGQHHVMSKIVGFAREQVRRAAPYASRKNREALDRLIAEIAHESERPLPDSGSFVRGSESALSLLQLAV